MKTISKAIAVVTAIISFQSMAQQLTAGYDDLLANQHGLVEIKSDTFDRVMGKAEGVKTHDNLRVYVGLLDVSAVEIEDTYKTRSLLKESFELTQADKEKLQTLFNNKMKKHMAADPTVTFTDNAEDADVVLISKVTKMAPAAPKDEFHSREIGMAYYTRGSGDMTLEFTVVKNGELVMKIEDTRKMGHIWQINNRMTNRANVKWAIDNWAEDITAAI